MLGFKQCIITIIIVIISHSIYKSYSTTKISTCSSCEDISQGEELLECIMIYSAQLSTIQKQVVSSFSWFYSSHCAKKPVKASARAIIKVSGHQDQWFPGVSQVVTM